MKIENVDNLEIRLHKLMGVTREKMRKLTKTRNWLLGFSEGNPATQAQIDHQISLLGLAEIQTALDDAKATFLLSDVLPYESPKVLPDEQDE
jgi:hypothetical protein